MNLSLIVKYIYPGIKLGSIDDDSADCAISVENGVPTFVVWRYAQPIPAPAELANAEPLAIAAQDAAIAENTQLQTDKATMKTAYTTAVTRLQTISTATFANNAQRDTAIQDVAKYLLALAKVVKGLL